MRAEHALFPGSFDPATLGHLDLVVRALALFGRVTIGVARHAEKRGLFMAEERVAMLSESLGGRREVEVRLIEGLVVEAARKFRCDVLVRGVRGGSDFDYEVAMARTNRELDGSIETVLLAPAPQFVHISSTLVRQIAELGGDVSSFVPAPVARELRARFPSRDPSRNQSPR